MKKPIKFRTIRNYVAGAVLGASLLFSPISCSKESGYEVTREVVDGVEIVSNPPIPRFGETGSLEKVLEIGVESVEEGDENNPELFSRIGGSFVKDNLIYVTDSSDKQVRIFNTDGQYQATLGRSGSGPGEFGFLFEVYVDDNHLVYARDRQSTMKIFDENNLYLTQRDIRSMFGPITINQSMALSPEDIILHFYPTQLKAPLEEKNLFARTSSNEMFWPARDYEGLRESLEQLGTDSDFDYGPFFTRGSTFLDESEQNIYFSRWAFPSEILCYSLDQGLFKILKRSPSERELITFLDLDREDPLYDDHRKMTDLNVVGANVPVNISRRGSFSERGIGIHGNNEQIFNIWRKRINNETLEHYVDILDKESGEYLYRIPFAINTSEFLGMDENNNLYFSSEAPYPHISGYEIRFKEEK